MREEEVRRAGVLKRVKATELSQVEVVEMLGLSYRQVKRLYHHFLQGGAQALVHRSAGKPSNRARAAEEPKQVLTLVRKHYGGGPDERFGLRLAAEHLHEDHGIEVDAETPRAMDVSRSTHAAQKPRGKGPQGAAPHPARRPSGPPGPRGRPRAPAKRGTFLLRRNKGNFTPLLGSMSLTMCGSANKL